MTDSQNDAAVWREVAHKIARELSFYTDSIDDPASFADSIYVKTQAAERGAVASSDHTIAAHLSDDEQRQIEERLQLAMATECNEPQDWKDAVEQQDA